MHVVKLACDQPTVVPPLGQPSGTVQRTPAKPSARRARSSMSTYAGFPDSL
jgi:hypothetical protein